MGKRIGVLGGSFDPLHYGHLILAEQIRQEADLDLVLLVPAYVNPFKEEVPPAEGKHRMAMLKLAVSDHKFFEISDIELQREGPSYTYDTLAELKATQYPDDELYFIMGTDSFYAVEHWHKAEELIRNFGFLIGMRKGYDEEELKQTIARLQKTYPLRAEYVRIPELEISSTEIKQRIRDGKSVRFMLPDKVIEYIQENELYLDLKGRLREYARRSEKVTRFRHTQGVVKLAKELALRWGADPEKAEIAAWFHDCCRPEGNLEHGPAAARLLQKRYGVDDEDILNAIRYHTTGRPGMSLLEMVLKTADQLEEGRTYPGVEEMRAFLDLPPLECVYKLMTHTREYVLSIGATFDPLSDEAIKWLKQQIQQGGNHGK
jgi:nicotinate-nucleotide adenylyltransferase